MSLNPHRAIDLTPAQDRRRLAIERRLLRVFDDLRALATEISGDDRPELFLEADGLLFVMRHEFHDEDPDWDTTNDRQSHVICSVSHGGIGSGAW